MSAKYTTYYISSSGQPANNKQDHSTLSSALDAWKSNCGALLKRSGGKSVIRLNVDEQIATGYEGDELIWMEHCEGGYLTGAMAEELLDAVGDCDVSTPNEVYNGLIRIS